MKKKCIIIGAGTYGQVYSEYLKDFYEVTGFYDDNEALQGHVINKIVVKGTVQNAIENEKDCSVFVPIGSNSIRVNLLKQFEAKGFDVPSFVHPKTNIHESVNVGNAVYILPGTNIMPLSTISNYVMISMGVNIAHHTIVEKGTFISQGVNVGASLTIKSMSFIGISSTIMTGVCVVGAEATVGAGAVVIKDVPDNAVVAGVPAKILRYKGQTI